MAKTNKVVNVLSLSAIAGVMASVVVSSAAFAAVDAYTVKVGDSVFEYNTKDLQESFLASKAGSPSALYNNFTAKLAEAKEMYAYHDAKTNRYIGSENVTNAFLADRTNFKLDSYVETDKAVAVAGLPQVVKSVTVVGGEIVLTEKQTSGEVKVASASAVKANALTVVFNKAVDTTKATFEVKNGSFLVPVTATWNDAKTEATLTKSFGKYMAGDYTVTVKGLDLKAGNDVAKTTIADETIDKIAFDSASLLKTANVGEATIGYTVTNQYGENITKTASINGVSSFGSVVAAAGVATVTKTANAAWATTDTTGSVTLYNGVKSVTVTVTVVAAVDVTTVTLGSMILPKDTERLIPSGTVTTANMSFEALDQYGKNVKLSLGALTAITPIYGGGISAATVIVDPNDATKQVIQVTVPVVAAKTTATLSLIVNKNGTTSTASFDMYSLAKVADFTLTPDTKVIKANTSYKVWIDAIDTYGNAVKAADLATADSQFAITSLNTDVFTVAGIELDPTTKKAYIAVTPLQAGKTANLVVTLKANGKNTTLPMSVNAASQIVGMKLSANTLNYATEGSATLKATFVDQYNEAVKADANYNVTIKSDDTDVIANLADATVAQIVAGVTVAPKTGVTNTTANLTVTLKSISPAKDIDAQVVKINVVDSSKTSLSYEIDDISTLNGLASAGVAGDDYVADLTLTAKDSAGNLINVPNSVVKSVTSTNNALVLPVKAVDGSYSISGLVGGISSGTTASATLTVIVENYDGTITTTTKTVTVSKSPIQAASLKAYSAVNVELAGDVEGLVSAKSIDSKYAANATFFFEALDQYGVKMAIPTYVVTNNTTGKLISVDATTGVITISAPPAAGTSFNLTAITANGVMKTVKVVY